MADPVTVSVSLGTLLFLGLAGIGVYALSKTNYIKEKMDIHKTIEDKHREAYQNAKLKMLEEDVKVMKYKNGAPRV